jgi:hypothetical protein
MRLQGVLIRGKILSLIHSLNSFLILIKIQNEYCRFNRTIHILLLLLKKEERLIFDAGI